MIPSGGQDLNGILRRALLDTCVPIASDAWHGLIVSARRMVCSLSLGGTVVTPLIVTLL